MKTLLSTHWEKLVLGFAALLVGTSAVWNLVLAQEPPAAVLVRKSIQVLDGIILNPSPPVLPAPKTLDEVQRRLAETPGPFFVPKDLVYYGGSNIGFDLTYEE